MRNFLKFWHFFKYYLFYSSHTKKSRLIDLIDEHVDHLNYIQDIYTINIQALSNCLTEQLIHRLLVPVYLNSLLKRDRFSVKVNLE
jgi:protein CLEC16A